MKRVWLWLCAAALLAVLVGCGAAETGETKQTETVPTETLPREVTMVVTSATIRQLEDYPELERADLTGSVCYTAIRSYIAAHPEVEVIYAVDLGADHWVDPQVQTLSLQPGEYAYDTLLMNLEHLPQLQSVELHRMELSLEEYVALRNAYPGLAMAYTVELCGTECWNDAEDVDLTMLTPEQIPEAARSLELLPALQYAELMDEQGNSLLSLEDVAELQKAAMGTTFHYSFELFGKTICTTDEEILYANQYIGNKIDDADEQLYRALTVLKGCKRFVLDNCHFDNETLVQIRDEFRDQTKLVWRVWFGGDGSCLTDREIIRFMPTLTGDNSHDLLYCEDARFIDVGHNEALFNVDFVAKMSKLEAIIVSGSPIRDLSAFAGCESLVFLELSYCGYVEDISVLAQCPNLKRVNIGMTKVSDISALDDLDLEVFVDTQTNVSAEDRIRFETLHPDCLVQHSGDQPYGYPWRYTEEGKYNEYYAMLRVIFDYDHPANTHW